MAAPEDRSELVAGAPVALVEVLPDVLDEALPDVLEEVLPDDMLPEAALDGTVEAYVRVLLDLPGLAPLLAGTSGARP